MSSRLAVLLAVAVLAGCGEEEAPRPTPTGPTAAELEAMDATAQSNARNAVTALETCYVTVQTYADCELPAKELPVGSEYGQVRVVEAEALTYRIAARSESGSVYSLTKQRNGTLVRECAPADLRDCTVDGTW